MVTPPRGYVERECILGSTAEVVRGSVKITGMAFVVWAACVSSAAALWQRVTTRRSLTASRQP